MGMGWRRLLRRPRHVAGEEPQPKAREIRAAFAARYPEVLRACRALAPAMPLSPDSLARDYMTALLSDEHPDGWWRDNAPYLTQPWRIHRWAVETGRVGREEIPKGPEYRLIRPAKGGEETAFLTLRRQWHQPDEGMIYLALPKGREETARALAFREGEKGWVRPVGETSAPLTDRAVEAAVALLRAGLSVGVAEPSLVPLILEERYEPQHRHWVLASARADRLRLLFPLDHRLFRYVRSAGGCWDGQCVEMPITCADKLEELMRLYGFRATRKAQRRLDAWHAAVKQAVVYRERQGKLRRATPPEDRFLAILNRQVAVPSDLRDNG